jgi:hypothetical protein
MHSSHNVYGSSYISTSILILIVHNMVNISNSTSLQKNKMFFSSAAYMKNIKNRGFC